MRRISSSKGFTIIELLIATVVFSVMLLIVSGAIIQIGRIYYKGVVQSRTQERARAIIEDISQNAQFGTAGLSSGTSGGYSYVCVGNRTYTYKLGIQQIGGQRGLVADNAASCSAYTGMTSEIPAGSTATELLGENMQLLEFTVSQSGDLITAHIRLAYGNTDDIDTSKTPKVCKPIILGGQYCAISDLTTTVTRRLK